MLLRLLAAGVATTLVVAGCSGANKDVPSAGGNAELGGDERHQPPGPGHPEEGRKPSARTQRIPSNFNTLNIDGMDADTGSMLKPTMQRAFVIAADGSMKVSNDYFTNVRLTSTHPRS